MKKLLSEKYIYFILFVFLFIYLALRASLIPLVHDEAATFFHYIHKASFIPPHAHWDANNHILNSALSYYSYYLFGSSELVLRLPNLLFFPLFFFFTYQISKELSNKTLRLTFIISLVFAHNFIEYFAFTRGYGMSMALLLGAIWYLIRVFKESRLTDYFLSALFMSLAISANLTLMNSAIIITGILFIQIIINFKMSGISKSIKALLILIITSVIPMIAAVFLLLEFKAKGLLYYGNLDGIWDLTVQSLIELFTDSDSKLIGIFIIAYSLLILLVFGRTLLKEKSINSVWKSHFVFFYLLVGNVIAILILGKILEVNYPEDRTGMYLFPYFIGSSIFLLDSMKIEINKKLLVVFVLPFMFFPVHFLYSMNLTHASFWKSERMPHRFYNEVAADAKTNHVNPTIGGYHVRALCWAYENFRHGGGLNQIQTKNYPEMISDFQIVDIQEHQEWLEDYDIVDSDDISKLSLLKRKNNLKSVLINQASKETKGWNKYPFYNLYRSNVDTLVGETLLLSIDFTLNAKKEPFIAWVVAQVSDEEKKTVRYEFISLDWKKTKWKGEKGNFSGHIIIHQLPKKSEKLSIYIWNMKKEEFLVDDISCSIDKLIIE
ncbi:MAG: hypothetical protein DRI74_08495 [Bacteroidetes bacterium]|nr:MAG: hypothetical protein DRI74_08495 [Bacteroidota bacterium]